MKEYLEERGRAEIIGYMNKELELQGILEDAEESGEAKGIEQGIEKGIEQGIVKGKIEMMLEDNYNNEDIMKRLSKYNVDIDLINEVRNSMENS